MTYMHEEILYAVISAKPNQCTWVFLYGRTEDRTTVLEQFEAVCVWNSSVHSLIPV